MIQTQIHRFPYIKPISASTSNKYQIFTKPIISEHLKNTDIPNYKSVNQLSLPNKWIGTYHSNNDINNRNNNKYSIILTSKYKQILKKENNTNKINVKPCPKKL